MSKKVRKPAAKKKVKTSIQLTPRGGNSTTEDGASSWVRFHMGDHAILAEIREFTDGRLFLKLSANGVWKSLVVSPTGAGEIMVAVRPSNEGF